MPEDILFNEFSGLLTSIADPKGNSLRDCKNLVLNKVSGLLEQADGYAKKLDLPVLSNPPYTNVTWENIHGFYIADHGGKNITVAIGTYRKTSRYDPAVYLDRMCVFINPYWNGSVWVDAWDELTEFEIVKLEEKPVDDIEPSIRLKFGNHVFPTDKFKNWICVFEDYSESQDHDNYLLICASGNDGTNDWIDYFGENEYLNRDIGSKMILCRSFLNAELPSSISTHIFSLLNEIRITTGNSDADTVLAVGLRNRTKRWFPSVALSDRVLIEPGMLKPWRYAFGIAGLSQTNETIDPVTEGILYIKVTLKDDLNNETDLRSLTGWSNYITVAASKKVQGVINFSPSAMPRNAKSFRVYVSRDNVDYNYANEYSIFSDATPYIPAIGETKFAIEPNYRHFYFGVLIELKGIDFDGPDAATHIGRSTADNGAIKYKIAKIVGETVFAIGVRDNNNLYKNTVFSSCTDGDGNQQRDIFPNDSQHIINLDYSDGDEIVNIGNIGEDMVFLKQRSIVLVTKDRYFGYLRKIITKNYGICSARSLVSYDDTLMWADYSGIIRYSSRGIEIINYQWLQDWLALSNENKEASIGVINPILHQYRLAVNGKEYVLDLKTNEWMIEDYDYTYPLPPPDPSYTVYSLQPQRYVVSSDRKILFLNGSKIYEIGLGDLHDGEDFEILADFNDIYPHHIIGAKGQGFDFNVERIILGIDCDIDLNYAVHKNLDANSSVSGVIPKTVKRKIVEMPNFRCNSLRLKLSASATGTGHKFKILRLGYAVALETIGGDITHIP